MKMHDSKSGCDNSAWRIEISKEVSPILLGNYTAGNNLRYIHCFYKNIQKKEQLFKRTYVIIAQIQF